MITTADVRAWVVLALSCVAVSACGGDSESSEGSSDFQRAIEPEAQARSESMLLTLSDFPDGWRTEEPSEEDEESDEDFRDCLGVDFSAFTVTGDAQSDDFAMGETALASSDAEVFENEQMAAEAVAKFAQALDGEEADACMTDLLGGFEDEDVEITGAEVGELSLTPPPGVDDAKAWQVTVTIEGKAGGQAEGVSVTGYFDLVQLRTGENTAEVTTGDLLTPFDPELRDDLIAALAERISE
jgi:hypothetical protein